MILNDHPYYALSYQPESSIIAILWKPETATMDDDAFKAALEDLAGCIEAKGARSLLIDLQPFRHRPGPEIGPWRQQVIVPRYNAAGLAKSAYVAGPDADIPAEQVERDGAPPPDSPERFKTRTFRSMAEAEVWLTAG